MNGATMVVDVVTEIRKETDMTALMQISLDDYWLFLHTVDGTKSGVLLPNTSWIAEVKQALTTLQKKYRMDGNVNIYVFKTERFVVE